MFEGVASHPDKSAIELPGVRQTNRMIERLIINLLTLKKFSFNTIFVPCTGAGFGLLQGRFLLKEAVTTATQDIMECF